MEWGDLLVLLFGAGGLVTIVVTAIVDIIKQRQRRLEVRATNVNKLQHTKQQAQLAAQDFIQEFGIKQIEQLRLSAEQSREIIDKINKDIRRKEAEIDTLKAKLVEYEKQINELKNENQRLIARLMQQEAVIEQRISALEENVKTLTIERDTLVKRLENNG